MAEIRIQELQYGKEIDKFINFPHDLHANDPNYVPEIFLGQKDLMNPKKHPFHQYGKARYFLAYKNGKIAGRIAAIENPNYNDFHDCNVGFFGFFDCENDTAVARILLDTAMECARDFGRDKIIGPTNFTTNDTAGTLIEGFNEPPKIMMTYNPGYYDHLMQHIGFEKEMDLFAYLIKNDIVSEKALRISDLVEERLLRNGIKIRKINLKKIDEEAKRIHKIYNAAWEKNWGFVPFTDAEFEFLKNDLKMIADQDFMYLAEKDDTPVGFLIAVPDINEILIKNKRGKLLPFGIFRLLFGKGSIKNVRILAMGVLEPYRKMGIEGVFFSKIIHETRKKGIVAGEASWILENNAAMNQAAINLNGEKYKTYRLYSKAL